MTWLHALQSFGITGAIQILVLTCLFYYIFLFFRGTRGAQVLVGLVLLIFVLIGLTNILHLDVLGWVLRRITVVLGIALLVIFQPEIRRALAELGKQPGAVLSAEKRTVIDHIVQASMALSEHRIGGLIAIEREIGTRAIQETGTGIQAPVVPELLACIFYPHTPLHDGGVIVSNNRIMAAGCIFPLSQNTELHKQFGTRHRAAVGISEETDAVVVVISEETGTISVAYGGRISRGLDAERLKRFLSALLRGKKGGSAWNRAKQQLDLTPEGIAKAERLVTQEKSGGE